MKKPKMTALRWAVTNNPYTVTEIAAKLGVCSGLVSQWMSGAYIPDKAQAKQLAKLLEVDVEILFPDVELREPRYGNERF